MKSSIDPKLAIVRSVELRCTAGSSDKGYRIEVVSKHEGSELLFGVLASYGRWPTLSNVSPVKDWRPLGGGADAEYMKRLREKERKGYKIVSADATYPLETAIPQPAAPAQEESEALATQMQACYQQMGQSVTSWFF